jgi:hypothetical protein
MGCIRVYVNNLGPDTRKYLVYANYEMLSSKYVDFERLRNL